jgi:hypothetical protein
MPVRSSERVDYKRCPRKWVFRWRMGLVPKARSFGALDLGTWMHEALASWYGSRTRNLGQLPKWMDWHSHVAIGKAIKSNAPEHEIDKARELANLGIVMTRAYEERYGTDPYIEVVQAEIPLEFTFNIDGTEVTHMLKPDMLYRNRKTREYWLLENKTARSIATEHLVIDDQGRPYGAMAELALKRAGVFGSKDTLKGVMYNFLRKAVPDQRTTNEKGQYLNKNGSVSKSQPPPYFLRYPLVLTSQAKAISLHRLRGEIFMLTKITNHLRSGEIDYKNLPITPHRSCPRFCDYFTLCTTLENGGDIKELKERTFVKQDPYAYPETTEETSSFEMG